MAQPKTSIKSENGGSGRTMKLDGLKRKGKVGVVPTFPIMNELTLFVYCFLQLNKKCYTFVRSLEAGLCKAAVSRFEFYIA